MANGKSDGWDLYRNSRDKQFPDTPFGARTGDDRGGKYNSVRSGASYDGPDVGPGNNSGGSGRGVSTKGGYSGTRGSSGFGSKTGHPHFDARRRGR